MCPSLSQCSLHNPAGGVSVVWSVCHGHLLRSGTHIYAPQLTESGKVVVTALFFIKSEISLSVFGLQLVSIITDETPIEQMRNRLMIKDRSTSSSSSSSSSTLSQLHHQPPHTRKPKLALLREVFGRGI